MLKRRNFTLVELLVVVGIITILAGLVLPAVMFAQQRGRITAAKSDIAAIIMAFKGVETTYGRMIKDGLGVEETVTVDGDEIVTVKFSDANVGDYNKLIAELTVPGKITSPNINKRKIKFLEPKPNFDPSKPYEDDENKKHLWRDPWGMPYVIIINANDEDKIPNPADISKTLATKIAVYSCGPNGVNNHGKNIEVDVGSPANTDDDIASWHK